jgi:hypothetical protein
MFTTSVKRFFYPLYILPKISGFKKKQLKNLFEYYRKKIIANEPVAYQSTGLRIFSNMEEDGIILWLIASLNIDRGNFIDIGANDSINSNCANLFFNFDWQGIFIDADKQLLKIGKHNYTLFGKTKKQNLKFIKSFLNTENVNDVINKNKQDDKIDFMSIDIDGNDYFIWEALSCVNPKIVLIENKVEYGKYDIVIPADKYFEPGNWGASPVSITKLAVQKGYRLAAANRKGFNMFFLRNDLLKNEIPELKIEDLLNDSSVSKDFYDAEKMNRLMRKSEAFKKQYSNN